MAFYKKYSQHRHGRDRAKERVQGYQSGGEVRPFPRTGMEVDLQRLRSAQGVESGRISKIGGEAIPGPGVSRYTGGAKPSWSRRILDEEMPRKKGGRVLTGGSDSGVGRLQLSRRLRKQK